MKAKLGVSKNTALFCGVIVSLGLMATAAHAATQIQSIDFNNASDASIIEIKADGPITFSKQENAQDKQLVLELSGVALGPNASRALDTSSFDSPIKLVSPFQIKDQPDNARLVVQFNEMAQSDVTSDGNTLRIKVPRGTSAPDQASADAPPPPAEGDTPPLPPADASAPAPEVAKAKAPMDKLGGFLKSQETQRFSGKPINLQLRDADLVDVFRLIGDASGFNIVVGEEVKGKVTLALADVPWDQVLDMILRTNKLGAERNNNVLRIASLQNLVQEKSQELQAKQASEASAPRVTRIFPISYANLTDLQKTLSSFVTASSSSGGGASGTGGPSFVQVDSRTNSIVVRETLENIDKMKHLIELLDTQTPQVLVEAKIVEVSKEFRRNLGGDLGLGNSGTPSWFGSFNGGTPLSALVGSASATSAGAIGTSIDFSVIPIPGLSRLNAQIRIGESESKLKVVSTPRTVVLNKQPANILQTIPLKVDVATIVNGVSTITSTFLQANVGLKVTPTVTNDGSVLMDLNIQRDVIVTDVGGANAIANRNITTQVLVESGSTLSVGGVYSQSRNDSEGGFPFLRKIPVIGWLFGSESLIDNQTELMIFVTPKILNLREAGMATKT